MTRYHATVSSSERSSEPRWRMEPPAGVDVRRRCRRTDDRRPCPSGIAVYRLCDPSPSSPGGVSQGDRPRPVAETVSVVLSLPPRVHTTVPAGSGSTLRVGVYRRSSGSGAAGAGTTGKLAVVAGSGVGVQLGAGTLAGSP